MKARRREQLLHEHWGRQIRSARRAARMTQLELARRLRVTQSAVSEWESGTKAPADRSKLRLAEVLKIRLDLLFPWPQVLPPESEEAAA